MKKAVLFYLLMCVGAISMRAQNVGINASGAAPDASALLDLSATNSGFLVPRMTLAQRNAIANPANSLLIYQVNGTTGYYYNEGTPAAPNWVRLYDGEGWSITGNNNTNAAANFLGTTNNVALRIRTNDIERFEVSTGTATTGGHLRAYNAGTAAAPTYAWSGAGGTTVGMFRPASNTLAFSTGSTERMRITGAGFFGIRTAAPLRMMHVSNGGIPVGAAPMAFFENVSTSGVPALAYNSATNNAYNAFEGATEYSGAAAVAGIFGLHLYGGPLNSYGIGTRGQSNDWQGTGVQGGRVNNGGIDAGWGGLFIADLGYTGGLFNASDARLKKDVKTLENALELLNQVNVVSYLYDTEQYPHLGFGSAREYGVIAQEIAEVLPEIVKSKALPVDLYKATNPHQATEEATVEMFQMVDYTRLIPLLVKGLQEQQTMIELQQQTIEQLLERVASLESANE